ncbi:20S proteasome subunit A/B [Leptospirillum ferriphilum]|uniref:Proteasome subunit alpha, bacterial n=3 Tax=Leptospirillum TaxID=179 RepID=A0A094WE42_9BACT|nr:20S proteasome subunit alpha [Leptospirillum ferriphilum]AFS54172.1 putative 20S proteasome alpha-subunit [Leptospirillum ferriphilum ML-04]EDZ40447.1 MAG: Probable 20S proteasome alpha-subunit [Leptospirillum sp. Group II '5-way CG']KGA93912.1 Proteasome subunit alpha, bacterial [Leptospirillum ferriphilum]MCL5259407.1 20S proteasome subunit A/B [Nitrospirota bacterium]
MFDEPYRWVEAVSQRREYIEEQLRRSSPVLGASVSEGILFLTFYKRIPKVYEIYDGLAMGAIGHPADIESIRMMLLNAAHVEGFQRSPKDVTLHRLLLFSLSPRLKNAFEDIGVSPILVRSLFGEAGKTMEEDRLMAVDFDGNIEEEKGYLSVAGSSAVKDRIQERLGRQKEKKASVKDVLPELLEAYLYGVHENPDLGLDPEGNVIDPARKTQAIRRVFEEYTPNACLLDRKKGSLLPVSLLSLMEELTK